MEKLKYIGDELTLFKQAHNWKKYFSEQISKYISGDVLEVGAGIGTTTAVLLNPQKVQSWLCLEPDSELAAKIPNHLSREQATLCTTKVGTISSLNCEGKYDTIIYIDVLEHIENHSVELTKAQQRLKNGGLLIVLVPAYQFLYSEFDRQVGHFRRYSRRTIQTIMPEEFRRKDIGYLDSIGLFASLMNKFVLKQDLPTSDQIALWDKVFVPLSKYIVDKLLFNKLGKSLYVVWEKV
ncbi:MAG: methyltransferase domain-containing protein [Pseudobacteriovorax sp.]|nr:methyltransferase domain-containing protein [Pseudobacteriovorax sp.]